MVPIVTLKCNHCKQNFVPKKKPAPSKTKRNKNFFCSRNCFHAFTRVPDIPVECMQCKKQYNKKHAEYKRQPNKHFCSLSCKTTWQNTHKITGYRRSKLEIWIEQQLKKLYPNLDLDFNNYKAINSELDIYIPSLSLAFELNGIVHYEPIYGKETLERMRNNDGRKFQACLENKIELAIIDTSAMSNFKERKARKYLDIITEIINNKIHTY